MKKKIIYIVLLIAVISSYPLYNYLSAAEDEEVVEKITEIKVKNDDLRITQLADGNLMIPSVDVLADHEGVLEEVLFKPGDIVEEGDLLAQISNNDLDALMREWKEDEVKYSSDLLVVEYNISEKNIAVQKFENDFENEEKLLALMNEYPDMYSLNEKRNQEILVNEISSDLTFAEKQLNNLYSEYNVLKDTYAALNEDYEMAMDMKIYADQPGLILSINTETGSEVNKNNAFATIGDIDQAYVLSEVSELDMGLIEEGQKTILNFEIDFGEEYLGTVEYISPKGKIDNNGIVTYEIKIMVDEPLSKVLDGLSGLVEFVIKEKNDVLVIPNNSVEIVEGKQQVEVKTEDGSEIREIVTGFTDGISTEVIKGLTEGETIVIRTIK
ncbi:MAG: efflux RND transporter periplasmic adaptor subunit [Bacillota bacterium]|nr:efflux RND transporter periplasmic adaptor subunit [Bacillota bacterium]